MDDLAALVLEGHVAVMARPQPGGLERAPRIAEEVARRSVAGIVVPGDCIGRLAAAVEEQALLAFGAGNPEGIVDGDFPVGRGGRHRDPRTADDGA